VGGARTGAGCDGAARGADAGTGADGAGTAGAAARGRHRAAAAATAAAGAEASRARATKAPVQPQGDLPPPRTPEPTPSPDTADANVAQTSAPPQVAADAAARYTAPQTTAGERSRAEATWEGRLLGHLQKHRRYPRQAERLRQQGVVYVRFAVARDGAVSVEAGRSSGFALLDQETLDTVQRASPVPAPPAEVAGDPVQVMVPVSFFLRGR
jgi:protein TonB